MRESKTDCKVRVAKSKIPAAGKGLFAKREILKDEVICFYSGKLLDHMDCKYVDPSYVVEFELGKGFKLVGDFSDKDHGIYANSIHPAATIAQNARFVTAEKKLITGNRGRFPIKATTTIRAGEEIFVNYGKCYWATLEKWNRDGPPAKSPAVLAREDRALRRMQRSAQ